jgi:hypothetical protein
MKQNITTIDYEWLTRTTGDPFAEVDKKKFISKKC